MIMSSRAVCLTVFLCIFCFNANAVIIYTENFDDGTANENSIICWEETYIPDYLNTPACMGGSSSRTLRTNSYDIDPIIGIDLTGCTGPATLYYTYFQVSFADVDVRVDTEPSGLNCFSPPFLSNFKTLFVTGSCVSESVPLTSGQINYVLWDRQFTSNALWSYDLSVDATCAGAGCDISFDSDFGNSWVSGSICDIFPALWETCAGNGPYITSIAPCGGVAEYAMALGENYPYSTATTVCIDLGAASSPTLRYSYSWDADFLSPDIEITNNGGGSWISLVTSHGNTNGVCIEQCVSLQGFVGQEIQLRFNSNYSGDSYHAYFDDITVYPHDGPCPTDTPLPTDTPDPPTDTPTPNPTDTPSSTPNVTSTPSGPTPTPPRIPATGGVGIGILLIIMGLLTGFLGLRKN